MKRCVWLYVCWLGTRFCECDAPDAPSRCAASQMDSCPYRED